MSYQRKSEPVPAIVRFLNPGVDVLAVWVEPWSERFEVAPQTALDVAFWGPIGGIPEIMPHRGGVVVYGWVGSEFIALQNSRVAGAASTVEEIIRQELEIAKAEIQRTAEPWPSGDLANAQLLLDQDPEVNSTSQKTACEVAAIVARSLAECLATSDTSRSLIWEIARRLVRTRGLFLADLENEKAQEFWTAGPIWGADLIFQCSISAIPALQQAVGNAVPAPVVKPRPAQSESGATPR